MESEQASDRVLTVPNALSVLRLLGVPLFLWLALGPKADGWAIVVLIISSFTDWLDGKLARLLHQTSRLGQLLDPAARAAAWQGRADDARATISDLTQFGYVPLDPWPEVKPAAKSHL